MARELTIEDLMKMDGQWVWCKYIGDFKLKSMYHVVDVRKRLLRELDNDDEWCFDNIGDDIEVYDKKPADREYLTDLEMIAKLRENPRLIAKENGTEFTIKFIGDDLLAVKDERGNDIRKHVAIGLKVTKQWEIINPSVTWQEALQAWAEGKAIECYLDSKAETYQTIGNVKGAVIAVSATEILNGTWYVKEEQ